MGVQCTTIAIMKVNSSTQYSARLYGVHVSTDSLVSTLVQCQTVMVSVTTSPPQYAPPMQSQNNYPVMITTLPHPQADHLSSSYTHTLTHTHTATPYNTSPLDTVLCPPV